MPEPSGDGAAAAAARTCRNSCWSATHLACELLHVLTCVGLINLCDATVNSPDNPLGALVLALRDMCAAEGAGGRLLDALVGATEPGMTQLCDVWGAADSALAFALDGPAMMLCCFGAALGCCAVACHAPSERRPWQYLLYAALAAIALLLQLWGYWRLWDCYLDFADWAGWCGHEDYVSALAALLLALAKFLKTPRCCCRSPAAAARRPRRRPRRARRARPPPLRPRRWPACRTGAASSRGWTAQGSPWMSSRTPRRRHRHRRHRPLRRPPATGAG